MAKQATEYFSVRPWTVEEERFDPERNRVAEAVFSLANEYMGVRGHTDEEISAPTLRGSYFNGIYEYSPEQASGYLGVVRRTHYMINSVDYFAMELRVDGVAFDQAKADISDYRRVLDMKKGLLTRELVWKLNGKSVRLSFERFLDMEYPNRAYQRVSVRSDDDVNVELVFKTDFNVLHWGQPVQWKQVAVDRKCAGIVCSTRTTSQLVASVSHVDGNCNGRWYVSATDRLVCNTLRIRLEAGHKFVADRLIVNAVDKRGGDAAKLLDFASEELSRQAAEGYDAARKRNEAYWQRFWNKSDIVIEGDDADQQGIRFCIFQLQQTYHGADPTDNIGAKGLTGEAYSGHAFWDTETYCLPYYLFNNPAAAKYLLSYRYNTLEQAKKRARDLDCTGACYPIATLNGEEACTLWQHASLQLQPTTAVAYGIAHYVNVCGDRAFLTGPGAEMLVEICRFLASRGQWDAKNEYFGYYGVMGPDEFQMMVNHNTYTNYMAKQTFLFTLRTVSSLSDEERAALVAKTGLKQSELDLFERCADKMLILYDSSTKLFEQHRGYYELPHIDVDDIPADQFPLYSHWSYDRIYRNDIIKQPDVLMFMFLYSSQFTLEQKRANYEFYEPRCIHESSLSPSVHSILASELGLTEQAANFFGFATRLDLDDYNRNTHEGLHLTSIAAAWMNIVYGFGGVRSDGELLTLNPTMPSGWKRLCFRLGYGGCELTVDVTPHRLRLCSTGKLKLFVYGKEVEVCGETVIPR